MDFFLLALTVFFAGERLGLLDLTTGVFLLTAFFLTAFLLTALGLVVLELAVVLLAIVLLAIVLLAVFLMSVFLLVALATACLAFVFVEGLAEGLAAWRICFSYKAM